MAKKKTFSSNVADLRQGDCLKLLKTLPDCSVDFLLSDPPYFLDQLDDAWSKTGIARNMTRPSAIGGLPVGMKFDPAQGRRLEAFFHRVSLEAIRVLKP